MKRILYVAALLCAFDFAAFGQGSAPLKVREVDGSPSKSGITTIVVSNGTLTISGTTATIATGGGGDTPGGSGSEIQYRSGATSLGAVTGSSVSGANVAFAPDATTGNGLAVAGSAITSGNLVSIAASGTAAASNTKTALNVSTSGANGTGSQTTYGIRASNTSTGSGTNIAVSASASGGTTNTALDAAAGNITLSGAGVVKGATSILLGGGDLVIYQSAATALTPDNNWRTAMLGLNVTGLRLASNYSISWSANSAGSDVFNSPDLYIRRSAAANLAFGAADAAAPVAQTLSVQSASSGTTNAAGAMWTMRGSLGTSQGVPGRIHLMGGAMIAASGTTQQTAVDRHISGATKVLTNNSATSLVNATAATETNAAGVIDYAVEVLDGTDVQYEVGSVAYGVSNKGGVFSGNTATKFGNHQNATSGTLTVTFAISGANPAVLSVNANSSLTPSTGYPRITYTLRNLTQQSVAVQ